MGMCLSSVTFFGSIRLTSLIFSMFQGKAATCDFLLEAENLSVPNVMVTCGLN